MQIASMGSGEACSVKAASAVGLPFSVTLTQDVEEEGVYIIVQGFVVQEKLAEQAQALAVHLVLLAIHLTHTLSSETVTMQTPLLTAS